MQQYSPGCIIYDWPDAGFDVSIVLLPKVCGDSILLKQVWHGGRVYARSELNNGIIESYRLDVNSYIVKPVDFDKLVEAVKSLGLYWLLLNEPPA